MSNSTQGIGTFATLFGTVAPTVLKYVQGDANITINNTTTGSNECVLVQLNPNISCTMLTCSYLQMPTGTPITVVDPTGVAACVVNVDQSVQLYGTSIDCLNGDFKCKSVSAFANAMSGLTLNGLGTGSKIVLAT